MKKILLALVAVMALSSTPALACSCMPDTDGSVAQSVINDSSLSLAKVYVRGMNTHNGQSMLELRETLTGGLMARNFRAKFGNNSCAVVPQNKKEQTLLIKFEKDGTYSIAGQCQHMAIMNYMKTHKAGQ